MWPQEAEDDGSFITGLDQGLSRAFREVRAWPAHDLFLPTYSFSMSDRGGVSVGSGGSGPIAVGYARIQANAGNTSPSGLAIFGSGPSSELLFPHLANGDGYTVKESSNPAL